MRVLLVEDNADIAANIIDFLEAEGWEPDHARDGLSGMHLALTQTYDVLILDIMLPGMDGLTLCSQLRSQGIQVPVLMLTARDTLPDKLAGFQAGSDDYLVKPFALPELAARVQALGQRRQRQEDRTLRLADLEMHPGTHKVTRAGRPITLNKVTYQILEILLKAAPNLVTRDELTWQIWRDQPPGSDALRSHLYALRQAVDKPFDQPLLHTIRGVGYRLAVNHEAS
ncbi:MAG: response regulator transcription factor [Acidobacteriota bacterium]|nr:response regulator transcription factor [Acidobacteriota bacterium]